jgi:DNA invertase Pin-like site-specific DNA recombinase
MRAAEYVRVSTDHQQYSIVNQQTVIAEYAVSHGFEVVRTYSDPAKSGLDIKHRPGLQRLLDDVLSGRADFKAVLVFDVSRWGRFQDSDEAACYEFLCKRAKIQVHYCAEPFANDGSVLSNFIKMVKRTMAAEYLRDLSSRVHAGQCRLASKGYKMGGQPGLGLRRVLLDANGNRKMILADGDRKGLALDRVSLTLGPKEEVRLVRRVFSMYLNRNMGFRTIARVLNRRHVPCGKLKRWDRLFIRRMLINPKYIGSIVFNRSSQTLGTKTVSNPPDRWIVHPNAFPAIVSQDIFDRTQAKIRGQVINRSNEQLLAELRAYIEVNKKGLPRNRKAGDLANAATYRYRFGSILNAYDAIGYRPQKQSLESLALRRRISVLKIGLNQQLQDALKVVGFAGKSDKNGIHCAGGTVVLEIARAYTNEGKLRWRVSSQRLQKKCCLIVARLVPDNMIRDFVLFTDHPLSHWGFTFTESRTATRGVVYETLIDTVRVLSRTLVVGK